MQHVRYKIQLMVVLLLAATLLGSGLAQAKDTPETGGNGERFALAGTLFQFIADAWNMGDEKALAGIVHPGGVRINIGGKGDRLTRYSPSQAVYFFKNLFQKCKTSEFSFVRVQDKDDQDRTHALAVWLWHLEGEEQDKEEKFVFVLRFTQDRWHLSEISSIK